jgi:hypothetical protein
LPDEGDFLRTPAGSCYRIDEVRPTRPGSKAIAMFVCTRLEREAVEFDQEGVWCWEFDSRSSAASPPRG